jgi:hypothetical protein
MIYPKHVMYLFQYSHSFLISISITLFSSTTFFIICSSFTLTTSFWDIIKFFHNFFILIYKIIKDV